MSDDMTRERALELLAQIRAHHRGMRRMLLMPYDSHRAVLESCFHEVSYDEVEALLGKCVSALSPEPDTRTDEEIRARRSVWVEEMSAKLGALLFGAGRVVTISRDELHAALTVLAQKGGPR